MQEILKDIKAYKHCAVIFQGKEKWLPAGKSKAGFTEQVTTETGLSEEWAAFEHEKWKKCERAHSLYSTNIYLLLNLAVSFGMSQLAITICLLVFCKVCEHPDPFFFGSGGDRRGGHTGCKVRVLAPPYCGTAQVAQDKGTSFIWFYHNSLEATSSDHVW